MSIALVNSAAASGTSSSAPISLPSGYASGDLLIVFLTVESYTPTTPSGWTLTTQIGTGHGKFYAYTRVSNGTEGPSVTFSLGGSTEWTALSLAYSGTSTTSPVNASGTASIPSAVASPVSAAVGSITTTVANTLLLYAVSPAGPTGTAQTTSLTAPSGFGTPIYGTPQAYVYQQAAASMAQSASGATGTITGTYSVSGNSTWCAILLALAPAASASNATGAATTTPPTAVGLASVTAKGIGAAAAKGATAAGVASLTAKGVGAAITKAVVASGVAFLTAAATGAAFTPAPHALGYGGDGSSNGVGAAATQAPTAHAAASASSVGVGRGTPKQPTAHGTAAPTSMAYGAAFTHKPIALGAAAGTAPLFPSFPILAGMGWPVKLTPNFVTITHQAAAGNSYRTAISQNPLHTIEAPINFLLQADYVNLKAFFEAQAGSYGPFYFTVPNGATYTCTFEDELEFEQFVYQIFKTKTLKLKEVR